MEKFKEAAKDYLGMGRREKLCSSTTLHHIAQYSSTIIVDLKKILSAYDFSCSGSGKINLLPVLYALLETFVLLAVRKIKTNERLQQLM